MFSIFRGVIVVVESSLRTKKYLVLVAICICSCAITGCIQSISELTSDSRLPKWITVPPGLTRADVRVVEECMEPLIHYQPRRGAEVKFVLYSQKYKKLGEVRGRSFYLSGRYSVAVVDGVPEIVGVKTQKNERGDDFPYFFVVDDPALKRRLLDENEQKRRDQIDFDYPALRKKLLDESGDPISDH
jgi:hypothetical protein